MTFSPDFFLQLVMALGASVGVYVGIKSDLAVTREKAERANKTADHAHRRIDDIFNDRK